jgi:hypothetical protein
VFGCVSWICNGVLKVGVFIQSIYVAEITKRLGFSLTRCSLPIRGEWPVIVRLCQWDEFHGAPPLCCRLLAAFTTYHYLYRGRTTVPQAVR